MEIFVANVFNFLLFQNCMVNMQQRVKECVFTWFFALITKSESAMVSRQAEHLMPKQPACVHMCEYTLS